MNNITQIYKNAIKSAIKSKMANITDTIIDTVVDSIGDDTNNNYLSVVSNVQEQEREAIIMIIKNTFEEIDRNYKKTKERFKDYVVQKSNVSRTVTTIFGELTFERTYYKSRLTNECHFLLDEMLGLPKYDKYDPIVKAYAIENYTKTNQSLSGKITGNQITTISNIYNNNVIHAIPRQSIHNWINKWNVPEVEYEQRETPKTLYIMVDEKYIGCQDKEEDIMVKSYVTFEDVIPVSKNRNELKNRLVYNVQSKHPWESFSEFLYSIYDPKNIENIYILSDAGNWITANISELKVEPQIAIKRLLCEFHYKQAVNRITTVEEERKEILKAFKEKNKKEFLELIDTYIQKYEYKKDTIEKQKTYIENNYTAIKDMLEFNIGSSMESHISHIIANPFASRPKGFSSIKINKYLKINDYVNNKINIFKLYLSSCNDVEDKKNDDNNKVTNNIKKYADYTCHPPILDNKVDETYQTINGILNDTSL